MQLMERDTLELSVVTVSTVTIMQNIMQIGHECTFILLIIPILLACCNTVCYLYPSFCMAKRYKYLYACLVQRYVNLLCAIVLYLPSA